MMPPSPEELRVLGCLIEKQRTTPDAYPLSVNALRLACNQSTNRDPVVDWDERTVRARRAAPGRARLGAVHQRRRAAAPRSTARCSTRPSGSRRARRPCSPC